MIAAEPTPRTVTPHGSKLLVRFIKPAEKTEAGLWLPDKMQVNTSEAEVIAAGPGRLAPAGEEEMWARWKPWPKVGNTVLFEDHAAPRVGEDEEGRGLAYIDSEAVLGVVLPSGVLSPLSDYLLIRPEARPDTSRGGIRLSDRVQLWRQAGEVIAFGPGLLQTEGGCAKGRVTVKEALCWPAGFLLVGATVYWERTASVLQVGREVVESWLIHASDVIAYDETTLIAEEVDRG